MFEKNEKNDHTGSDCDDSPRFEANCKTQIIYLCQHFLSSSVRNDVFFYLNDKNEKKKKFNAILRCFFIRVVHPTIFGQILTQILILL